MEIESPIIEEGVRTARETAIQLERLLDGVHNRRPVGWIA